MPPKLPMSIILPNLGPRLALNQAWPEKAGPAEQDVSTCAALELILGQLYYARGEFDKALWHLEQIVEQAEQLSDQNLLASAYAALGDVHYREGRYNQAKNAYQRAIELNGLQLGPATGGMDAGPDGLTDSLAPFQRLIELDPRNLWAHYALGAACTRGGKGAEAIEAFERCLDIDEQFIPARLQLAALYEEQGDHAASISEYRAAIDACEDDDELLPDLYLGLGDAYRGQENYDLCVESYQQAIRAIRASQGQLAKLDRSRRD